MKQQNLFLILIAVGFVVTIPYAYSAVEPSIIINMDAGQVTKPFQIKDNLGAEVFSVDVDGTIFPPPAIPTVTQFTQQFGFVSNQTFNVPLGQTLPTAQVLFQVDITREVGLASMQVYSFDVVLQAEVERPTGSFGTFIALQETGSGGAGTWTNARDILGVTGSFVYDHERLDTKFWRCVCTGSPTEVETIRLVLYNFDAGDAGNVRNISFFMDLHLPVGYTATQVI